MAEKPTAPLITPQMLRDWHACYEDEQIQELYAWRAGLSPLQICELRIPVMDRLWVVLREAVIPEAELHQLGLIFIRDAVLQPLEIQQAGEQLLDVKRQWLAGRVTNAELSKRRSDFWAAAVVTTADPDQLAVRYAASDSGREASYIAAAYLQHSPRADERAFHWLDAVRKTLARLYTEPERAAGASDAT